MRHSASMNGDQNSRSKLAQKYLQDGLEGLSFIYLAGAEVLGSSISLTCPSHMFLFFQQAEQDIMKLISLDKETGYHYPKHYQGYKYQM